MAWGNTSSELPSMSVTDDQREPLEKIKPGCPISRVLCEKGGFSGGTPNTQTIQTPFSPRGTNRCTRESKAPLLAKGARNGAPNLISTSEVLLNCQVRGRGE